MSSSQHKDSRLATAVTHGSSRRSDSDQLSGPVKWDEINEVYTVSFGAGLDFEHAMVTSPLAKLQEQEPRNGDSKASSTVAAGSLSQQRLIQEALAQKDTADTPKEHPEGLNQSISSSSIPWSASQSSPAGKERRATASISRATPDFGGSLEDTIRHDEQTTMCSVLYERGPDNANQSEIFNSNNNEALYIDSLKATEENKSRSLSTQQNSGSDSLSIAEQDDTPGNRPRSRNADEEKARDLSSQRAADLEQNELRSDEIAIGLPKEQYKPRPSRSRSAIIEQEPLDLSVPPEKVAKTRRRKTTEPVTATGSNSSSSKEKLTTITSMGLSPSQAKKALKDLKGNVEKAIDRLCNAPSSNTQDSLDGEIHLGRSARKPSAVQARESISRGIQEDPAPAHEPYLEKTVPVQLAKFTPDDTADDVNTKQIAAKAGNSLSHVEITPGKERNLPRSSASSKRASKKAKRRKTLQIDEPRTSSEIPASDVETVANGQENTPSRKLADSNEGVQLREANLELPQDVLKDIPQETERLPTKRGRGRPKKIQEESPGRAKEAARPCPDDKFAPLDDHLKEIQGNALPSDGGNLAADDEPSKSTPKQQADDERLTKSALPATASTPPQKAGPDKNPRQHSPVSKGKVPYRVGLSRRARIAPLLKMVKK